MHGLRKVAALAPMALLVFSLAIAETDDPPPQQIHFDKGKSSATIQKTLEVKGDDAETHAYRLHAGAGQVLTVHFEAAEPKAGYNVTCPRNGIAHAKGKTWSLTLPESGDYTITVSGSGAKASFPYTLEVGVEGKPRAVPAQGVTGTWALDLDSDNTIEVKELPGGTLRFAVDAVWKGRNWKEYGPNMGQISGTAGLKKSRISGAAHPGGGKPLHYFKFAPVREGPGGGKVLFPYPQAPSTCRTLTI